MTEIYKKLSEITAHHLTEVYFGFAKYPKGGRHGPRVQRGIQLFHLLSGQVTLMIDGTNLILNPGDFALLVPGRHEFHQFSLADESVHTWCQLDFSGQQDSLQSHLAGIRPVVEANYDIQAYMDLGLALTRAPSIPTGHALLDLGQSLLNYYLAYANTYSNKHKDSHPVPRSVRMACDYMSRHLEQTLNLNTIAQVSHVSTNHLILLFKQYLQITPSRYLWKLRCQHAATLLRDTNIPIALVAEQAGFASAFHFSRLFKQVYGESPRAFRNK
ncbi:AraC family transcriptional regulator [Marinomonas transparens]|uniref:Helix-turn-helix transcriptional regulator n=1 Tax=Marinomonas transparens TaxID=2795388 RepID=A0A934JHM2_9GAMM|nr:AraC family transcriptional regulator [Marinomonas transparens]MBJ7536190.1 helix-turn-helix transcriptional regulator [Marinomonas transparens]